MANNNSTMQLLLDRPRSAMSSTAIYCPDDLRPEPRLFPRHRPAGDIASGNAVGHYLDVQIGLGVVVPEWVFIGAPCGTTIALLPSHDATPFPGLSTGNGDHAVGYIRLSFAWMRIHPFPIRQREHEGMQFRE